MLQFLLGIVITVAGALITVKSEAVLNSFGRMQWFEEHLGVEGGSRLGYKLVGLAVFFIGVLTMTGLIGGFMEWVLSPLLRYSRM